MFVGVASHVAKEIDPEQIADFPNVDVVVVVLLKARVIRLAKRARASSNNPLLTT